jgi:predicted lipid-binding transport protein (Tim44 family)
VFIFLKLRKQLGQIDEEEKRRLEKMAEERKRFFANLQQQNQAKQSSFRDEMKVVKSSSTADENPKIIVGIADESKLNEALTSIDEQNKNNFLAILAQCKISADFFVNGARSAFEMIIKAFADEDLETLKFLLSDKIYQAFAGAIAQRRNSFQKLTTNVIAIEKVEIISAAIADKAASVVVKFVSQQINYVSDSNGNIVTGRKDEIKQITDIWTFRRDIDSKDPNWLVVVTN